MSTHPTYVFVEKYIYLIPSRAIIYIYIYIYFFFFFFCKDRAYPGSAGQGLISV